VIVIVAFMILLFLVSAYAQWRGGAPERIAAMCMVAAMMATFWAGLSNPSYRGVEWDMLLIDLGLLLALAVLAGLADRFWPIWLAAFQLVTVAAHGVTAYNPGILPVAYWWLVGKIAYPMVAILAIGTRRHHRRIRSGHQEYAWTYQRHRAASSLAPAIAVARRS
jgi:hypothetical protein